MRILTLGIKHPPVSSSSPTIPQVMTYHPWPAFNKSSVESVSQESPNPNVSSYTLEKAICNVMGWRSRDLDLSPRSESFLVTSLSPNKALWGSVWPIFKMGLKTLVLPHLFQSDHILESFLKESWTSWELLFPHTSNPVLNKQPRCSAVPSWKTRRTLSITQPSGLSSEPGILKPGSWLRLPMWRACTPQQDLK